MEQMLLRKTEKEEDRKKPQERQIERKTDKEYQEKKVKEMMKKLDLNRNKNPTILGRKFLAHFSWTFYQSKFINLGPPNTHKKLRLIKYGAFS